MSTSDTFRNVLLALLVSLTLTFVAAAVYVLYPLARVILLAYSGGTAGSGGVGAVAGGVSESLLLILLLCEPLLFLVVFALLRRRRAKVSR
jgi:hypothetical protein